ncbi:hypothetical protein [Luteolibacter sp. AS25]|uniref:hypothetical protein n=1 Tax=Luteolibacter sp. AS25 TaxID=3135776 RepID=UPI00398A5C23
MIVILIASCRSDTRDAVWWRNEKVIIELNNQIELTNLKLQHAAGRTQHDSRESTTVQEQEIAVLKLKKATSLKRLAEKEATWATYRESVLKKCRSAYEGRYFPEFKTLAGRKFSDCTVTRISNGGVSLRHANGTVRLSVDELSFVEHKKFGIDPSLALELYASEHENRIIHEIEVTNALAKNPPNSPSPAKSYATKSASIRAGSNRPFANFAPLGTTRKFSGVGSINRSKTSSHSHAEYESKPRVASSHSSPRNSAVSSADLKAAD